MGRSRTRARAGGGLDRQGEPGEEQEWGLRGRSRKGGRDREGQGEEQKGEAEGQKQVGFEGRGRKVQGGGGGREGGGRDRSKMEGRPGWGGGRNRQGETGEEQKGEGEGQKQDGLEGQREAGGRGRESQGSSRRGRKRDRMGESRQERSVNRIGERRKVRRDNAGLENGRREKRGREAWRARGGGGGRGRGRKGRGGQGMGGKQWKCISLEKACFFWKMYFWGKRHVLGKGPFSFKDEAAQIQSFACDLFCPVTQVVQEFKTFTKALHGANDSSSDALAWGTCAKASFAKTVATSNFKFIQQGFECLKLGVEACSSKPYCVATKPPGAKQNCVLC